MKDTELKDTNLIFGDYYLFICYPNTKQVKRFVDWTKGGFGGKLEG